MPAPADPALVARAEELLRDGGDVADVAEQTGLSLRTCYRILARGGAARPAGRPAPPVLAGPAAPLKPALLADMTARLAQAPLAQQAALVEALPYTRAADAAPTAPPREAPAPIAPKGDIREELLELLAVAKGMLRDAAVSRKGFAAIGGLIDKIAARIQAIDTSRRDTSSEAAAIMARGAAGVAKIRAGAAVLHGREIAAGACCRCGHALSEEQLAKLRAEHSADPYAVAPAAVAP